MYMFEENVFVFPLKNCKNKQKVKKQWDEGWQKDNGRGEKHIRV